MLRPSGQQPPFPSAASLNVPPQGTFLSHYITAMASMRCALPVLTLALVTALALSSVPSAVQVRPHACVQSSCEDAGTHQDITRLFYIMHANKPHMHASRLHELCVGIWAPAAAQAMLALRQVVAGCQKAAAASLTPACAWACMLCAGPQAHATLRHNW